MEFHENPTSGSRVVPCGQTDGRTDIKKLIFALRNFGNAPKNEPVCVFLLLKLFNLTATSNAPVLGIK